MVAAANDKTNVEVKIAFVAVVCCRGEFCWCQQRLLRTLAMNLPVEGVCIPSHFLLLLYCDPTYLHTLSIPVFLFLSEVSITQQPNHQATLNMATLSTASMALPANVTPEQAIKALHDHDLMIKSLCPQLVSYTQESGDPATSCVYAVTDKKPIGTTASHPFLQSTHLPMLRSFLMEVPHDHDHLDQKVLQAATYRHPSHITTIQAPSSAA
jgi:hypothetical protein